MAGASSRQDPIAGKNPCRERLDPDSGRIGATRPSRSHTGRATRRPKRSRSGLVRHGRARCRSRRPREARRPSPAPRAGASGYVGPQRQDLSRPDEPCRDRTAVDLSSARDECLRSTASAPPSRSIVANDGKSLWHQQRGRSSRRPASRRQDESVHGAELVIRSRLAKVKAVDNTSDHGRKAAATPRSPRR